MAKDLYGFLRNHKEDIAQVLSVGWDVANYVNPDGTQPFVDFTREEAKELYIRMIEIIQEPRWNNNQIMSAIHEICEKYQNFKMADPNIYYKMERIARTELNRILFYAKEQMALEDGDTDSYFEWSGPLDRRTTPMCRFMQTGELKGENRDGTEYDYEYLRSELPEWKEEGQSLPDLKQMCRDVHDVFYNHGLIKTPMITDWQMHINCRHTFHRTRKIPVEDRPIEVDGWIQTDNVQENPVEPQQPVTYNGIPDTLTVVPEPTETEPNPMHVDLIGDAVMQADGTDDLIADFSSNAQYTFGFEHSFKNIPLFILPESDENDESAIFQFSTIDEYQLGSWLRFIVEELDAEMDFDLIIEVIYEESDMTQQELGYIQKNWDWLFDVAMEFGWIL